MGFTPVALTFFSLHLPRWSLILERGKKMAGYFLPFLPEHRVHSNSYLTAISSLTDCCLSVSAIQQYSLQGTAFSSILEADDSRNL